MAWAYDMVVASETAVFSQVFRNVGLVTRLVPDDRLETEAQGLAEQMATGPTFALGMAKKMFKSVNTPSLETYLDTESWAQGVALMSEDHAEGIEAFKTKRKPVFRAR